MSSLFLHGANWCSFTLNFFSCCHFFSFVYCNSLLANIQDHYLHKSILGVCNTPSNNYCRDLSLVSSMRITSLSWNCGSSRQATISISLRGGITMVLEARIVTHFCWLVDDTLFSIRGTKYCWKGAPYPLQDQLVLADSGEN